MEKSSAKYLVLIGVFFTSLSSIIVRISQSPSLVISFYRMLFTVFLLLFPVILKERKVIKSITKKDLILCIVSGTFLALHFASWIASINMTTISNSTILVSCSPIFVSLANYLILKEKFTSKMLIGLTMSLIGTGIIAMGSSGGSTNDMMLGNILAFMGAIFVAGYFVIGGIVRKNLSAGSYVFIVYSASVVVLFFMCLLTKTPIYPYSPKEFLLFFALAFFCSILGHTVYNYLMKYISATMISISTLCEPIFASILALIIFKEIPSIYTLIGGTIVLSGVFYYILSQTSKKIKKQNIQ
ncbi:drug/metabolite transporter (DMT)-like permease [Sedimentibacter acidaminivorans]|uniref:Drug/metabolite transporter (DMT)-like permease n=1 Tax=Sedimentibacter acidaminivorans TaxID=913099 RepID=A0ABS4GH37_9FIRM|nr:DMT family transporter [Sedimentibacter acidaminivorans]MBP1927006.1 drug/metabolite transporter (DMT)-like permease [Sedimentibacter acidaminivorans]